MSGITEGVPPEINFTPKSWGQCYDHNFLQFLTIFGKQIGVFLKNNVMIKILHILGTTSIPLTTIPLTTFPLNDVSPKSRK
jgi:hypothetical protein